MAVFMSVAWLNPRAALDAATRTVRAEFEIRNLTEETWRAADGFGIGYHLFDRANGTLIVDGARVRLERDVEPGGQARVFLEFELPAEDGEYETVISPMSEDVCWYYDRGWPFLLVETATKEGVATLRRTRVMEKQALRRERELRGVGRAFLYPVLTIWRNRALIRVMAKRDIMGRYKGSFGGAFWTIINPLLLMLTYFFVFGVVIRDPSRSRSEFALYFLAGMLPWLPFSEAAGRSPGVILENRNLIKKLVFPVDTLPVNLVASGLVTEMFAVALYCVFLLALRHNIPPTVLWLPVLLIPQILFTAGVSWFLAGLGAYVKDLGQVIGFVLTIWFFMTPICYPEKDMLFKAPILAKNPMYVLVRGYRSIFLENQHPAFGALWKFWLLAAVVFVLGHAWFYKLRKSFADTI
jgi:lipopolysaccharide transport system permease protein